MIRVDRSASQSKADFIRIADAARFTPSGDFTLEFADVVFLTTTGTQTLYNHYFSGTNNRCLILEWVSGTGLRLALSNDGINNTIITYNWTPTTSIKYQIAVDRSGSTVRVYVDGAVGASGTKSGALFNSTDAVYIGCANLGTPPQNLFSGYADGFRFTVGTARYAGAYTPPTLPFPTA